MMRRIQSAALALVFGLATGQCVAQEHAETAPAPVEDPLFADGQLHRNAEAIGQILCLVFQGRRMVLDRASWVLDTDAVERQKQVDRLVEALTKNGMAPADARAKAENELVSRGLARRVAALKRAIEANREATWHNASGDPVRVIGSELLEISVVDGDRFLLQARQGGLDPVHLELQHGAGSLTVMLVLPGEDGLLWFRQTQSEVTVTEVSRGKLRRFREKDFASLCIRYRDFAEDRIIRVFRHYGLSLPFTPYSKGTVALVMAMLADPVTQKERSRFDSLLAELAGGSYRGREAANKALSEAYPRWVRLIREAARTSRDPEQSARLDAIIEQHRGKCSAQELVHDLGLLDNPRYLAGLLSMIGEVQTGTVLARLKEITGKELSSDEDAWRGYLDRLGKEPEGSSPRGAEKED